MLALWRDWSGSPVRYSDRIAASLGMFAGFPSAYHASGDTAAAFLSSPRLKAPIRHWKPHRTASGDVVLFHGRIHNFAELAEQLGISDNDPAALYGAAVLRWQYDADHIVIGEYCSIIAQADKLRLVRSPWSAPPLYHCNFDGQTIAASVPRVLLAAGLPADLDPIRLADNLYFNLLDRTRGWYRGMHRVAYGSVVTLDRRGGIETRQFYDPRALPEVRLARDQDYVETAYNLLGEATAKAMKGAKSPGIMLSGGLDSPLVAAAAMQQLPPGQRLPSFTFAPGDDWRDRLPSGMFGDEREFVRAFAAMHPALEPHFTQNPGIGFDTRWLELFSAIGNAPNHLCNFYVYHGVWAGAQQVGCDLLLTADFGNQTYSNDARWGFVEYLKRLRWRQLWLALRDHPADDRSMLHKLAALSLLPLLPLSLRRAIRQMRHPNRTNLNDLVSMLPDQEHGPAAERARRDGALIELEYSATKVESFVFDYNWRDCEGDEVQQGFEQVYGVRQVDVPAYRPLAEFCAGLPTDQFLRDGQSRWLARRMAVGRLPEAQRTNVKIGRHNADWFERLTPRLAEFRIEAQSMVDQPDLAGLIDPGKILAILDAWPDKPGIDPEGWIPQSAGLPRGLLTARFVAHVTGRNAQ